MAAGGGLRPVAAIRFSLIATILLALPPAVDAWMPQKKVHNTKPRLVVETPQWLGNSGILGGSSHTTTDRRRTSIDDLRESPRRKPKEKNNILLPLLLGFSLLSPMLPMLSPPPAGAILPEVPELPAATVPQQQQNKLSGPSYWSTMESGSPEDRLAANRALFDHTVGTISTMYYDHSGGAQFDPRTFVTAARAWKRNADENSLATRNGAVAGLAHLVAEIHDPYSRYLTREELQQELRVQPQNDGFLGLGAMVEAPAAAGQTFGGARSTPVLSTIPPGIASALNSNSGSPSSATATAKTAKKVVTPQPPHKSDVYSAQQIAKLPVVTAVAPHSPAERTGITVGDRILAVGQDSFLGLPAVEHRLHQRYHADNYVGYADLTIAKPVVLYDVGLNSNTIDDDEDNGNSNNYLGSAGSDGVIVAYRSTRVRVGSASLQADFRPGQANNNNQNVVAGGDAIVHYQLLNGGGGGGNSGSSNNGMPSSIFASYNENPVGYIRLTRFSKASTAGYIRAVQALEDAGATAYIIDLRNNYGGVIQEALLTASTLFRDPHAVLCYTMNSRGGFTPHDVEEYVIDQRYPGYLLSQEPTTATLEQIRKESPRIFAGNTIDWSPPSSYASLHEQSVKRGIHRITNTLWTGGSGSPSTGLELPVAKRRQLEAQKSIVVLVNEGTASSAEVFTAALHDNGRTVAVVGTKTYGKGLIQHTFPLPDGAGLRLTVAEYLTPALQHVTKVGAAGYDRMTGRWVGGGIQPDIYCPSPSIPANIGADFCVGTAMDVLEEVGVMDMTSRGSSVASSRM